MNIQELQEDNNLLNTKYYMSKNTNLGNSNKVQNINKNNLNFNLNYNKNITRINIDSRYRNIESKNIISNNITYLTNNPLFFTNNSNIIKIYHTNHGFQKEDKIILQGVQPDVISIINGLSFIFYVIHGDITYYILVNYQNKQISTPLIKYNQIIFPLLGGLFLIAEDSINHFFNYFGGDQEKYSGGFNLEKFAGSLNEVRNALAKNKILESL
jgi:hypothetical protein